MKIVGVEVIGRPGVDQDVIIGVGEDDPNILLVEQALLKWTEVVQAVAHVNSWTPFRHKGPAGQGCTSGHLHPKETNGQVTTFCTIDDVIGGAEGFVHEAAHQRLNLLGLQIEEHDGRLIQNDSEAVFFSPIRRDCLRPMSALIHGIYAWTHMLEVDIANEGAYYLSVNVPKVRMGLSTIKEECQPTAYGRAFFEVFYSWADSVVENGSALLKKMSTEEVPVPGLGE
jgi:hypothetical protein